MKVSELFEADMPKTPEPYREEWDVQFPKKVREIATKNGLTVKMGGTALTHKGSFAGHGWNISLTPRRAPKDETGYHKNIQHAENNPEKYAKFWKEFYDEFHDKYDLTSPIAGRVAQPFKANTPMVRGAGNNWKIYMHPKNGVRHVDKNPSAKIEEHLQNLITLALQTAVQNSKIAPGGLEGMKKSFNRKISEIRDILTSEKEAGREYPRIEKQLERDTFEKTLKDHRLNHHTTNLSRGIAILKDTHNPHPGSFEAAIESIKDARENGHPLPELEKLMPEKDWDKARKMGWETYFTKRITDAVIKGDVQRIGAWMTDLKKVEHKLNHKFTGLDDLLDKDKLPKKFFQVVTHSENPTTEEVIKYILSYYKETISGHNYNNNTQAIIDMARKAGFNSPELGVIEKHLENNKSTREY